MSEISNKNYGDINKSGAIDDADQKLFEDIMDLDLNEIAVDLSDGINDEEAKSINDKFSLNNSASEWNNLISPDLLTTPGQASTDNLLEATPTGNTAVSESTTAETTSETVAETAAWTSLLSELGIDGLSEDTFDPNNVTWGSLGAGGVMTQECFKAIFDKNQDGRLTLKEMQEASDMLKDVANSGIMGKSDLKSVFEEYAKTNIFFTLDLADYEANKEPLDTYSSGIGASHVWDLISSLLQKNVDICIDASAAIKEIDVDKLLALITKVRDLSACQVMGKSTNLKTTQDEYLSTGFTINAEELTAEVRENLEKYLKEDPRATSIWDLLKKLQSAGKLQVNNGAADLTDVNDQVTAYLTNTIEGGGAGLIDKFNRTFSVDDDMLMHGYIDFALDNEAFNSLEKKILTKLQDIDTFRGLAGGGFKINADQLDSMIRDNKPELLF